MEHLVRSCYKQGGYQFAKKPTDIAREYGVDRIARLASNENPKAPSPAVIAAAEVALRQVNRYPDERVDLLTTALRQHYGGLPVRHRCGYGRRHRDAHPDIGGTR